MKRTLLALFIALPLVFSSCGALDSFKSKYTGNMHLITGGSDFKLFASNYYVKDGVTYIAASDGERTITIKFKGTTPGTYSLGVAASLENVASIASSGLNSILNAENILMHIPTNEYMSSYMSLTGKVVITEYSDKRIVGTFHGIGINKDQLSVQGILNILIDNSMDFSGGFTSVKL